MTAPYPLFIRLFFLLPLLVSSFVYFNSEIDLCKYLSSKSIRKVLVTAAHPDDIETIAGGTIAAMSLNCSIEVFYLLTTNGDKGWGKDDNMTR